MTYETISKQIPLQTLVDILAAHLYATSIIDDNVEIEDIIFGKEIDGQVSLQIETKKEVSTKLDG